MDWNADRALFRFEVIDGDDDPRRIVEQFNSYFQTNYHGCPAFFSGTLDEALNEAFQTKSMEDVRRTDRAAPKPAC